MSQVARWQLNRLGLAGAEYFFNSYREAAHFRPPSLSWTTHVVQGHRAYQNRVTHQETWKLPDALAWRRIDSADHKRHFWFNFRTGTSMHAQPAELAGDALEEALAESRSYWRHSESGAPRWAHMLQLRCLRRKRASTCGSCLRVVSRPGGCRSDRLGAPGAAPVARGQARAHELQLLLPLGDGGGCLASSG